MQFVGSGNTSSGTEKTEWPGLRDPWVICLGSNPAGSRSKSGGAKCTKFGRTWTGGSELRMQAEGEDRDRPAIAIVTGVGDELQVGR